MQHETGANYLSIYTNLPITHIITKILTINIKKIATTYVEDNLITYSSYFKTNNY